MSESNTDQAATTNDAGAQAHEPAQADAGGGAGKQPEPKTFTQEEVNAIVEKRVARVKSQPPADYDELKAKAAKYDEAQEAAKSELQKATESAEKWKGKYEQLKAEAERREAIAKAAAEHGVSAAMLARMSGDPDENAAFLKEQLGSVPKYGDVHDGGEQGAAPSMSLEEVRAIKDPMERLEARAEYIKTNS